MTGDALRRGRAERRRVVAKAGAHVLAAEQRQLQEQEGERQRGRRGSDEDKAAQTAQQVHEAVEEGGSEHTDTTKRRRPRVSCE